MGHTGNTLRNTVDPYAVYVNCCESLSDKKTVIFVGSQRVDQACELFYTPVSVGNRAVLRGMLDSGSMSCTISEEAESKLQSFGVVLTLKSVPENVVMVGCGGLLTRPKCIYNLDLEVYGFRFEVPTFVVPGQRDELIIGTNVLRPVIQKMKCDPKYWELISSRTSDPGCDEFLQLLSCTSRWSGSEQPDKIGSVKLRQAVTLLPQKEYVVWGKLPSSTPVSPGCTVIVEPSSTRSAPKSILVGRVVTPMWGDHWIPMKVLNPTLKPITLRRNTKIADVFSCVAVEDMTFYQGLCKSVSDFSGVPTVTPDPTFDPVKLLAERGLGDIDVQSCEVSDECKRKLAHLLLTYQDVFSRDKLDCGEAKDFVHRIHLTDDRPFRLPYRRVPPAHYQQLREVLSDMEIKGIISDRVLVANKNARGRRKLSDRWEPIIYTVVASKPAIHIYRIRDAHGNERVVHRNLLLDINFLPLMVDIDNNASCSVSETANTAQEGAALSVVDAEAGTVESSLAESLTWPSESADDRTSEWVRQFPTSVPDNVTSPGVQSCDDSVHPISCPSEPHIVEQPTTRFGRVIEPVCRLIDSMAQIEILLDV
ncbi:uncharacterized protein LOC144988823 [Oryzias latipes]